MIRPKQMLKRTLQFFRLLPEDPPPPPPDPYPALIFNPRDIYWSRSVGKALDERPDAKIVVFGLPKSGNVWMQSLLQDYFELPSIDPILEVEKRGVGTCHWAFRDEFWQRADLLHGVCIVRDVRDVVASFFHYAQTDAYRKARPEFDYPDIDSFYYEYFLPRMVTTYRWHQHSQEYAALGVPIVRYERLFAAPQAEFTRLISRWGLPVNEERIRAVIERNSLAELKKGGKTLHSYFPPTHFRRGGSGNYRQELPPYIIADIEERFREFLVRWGYNEAGSGRTSRADSAA
jgi:hypothetical protein